MSDNTTNTTNSTNSTNSDKETVLAICYDFDKTLSPKNMQEEGFIEALGGDEKAFWKDCDDIAKRYKMDSNLAYMYNMIKMAKNEDIPFNKPNIQKYAESITLYDGVKTWFNRINDYGKKKGIIVEHYIISSGLKEMVEATEIAGEFKEIYACSFCYDNNEVPFWPAQVVNYTGKTQFLFRIEKGVLDINDDAVNNYYTEDKLRVPFRNMVYIGDSATDVPCMKLVNLNGGHSIGVYNPETKDKSRVYDMIKQNRIKYFVPADYTENSKLEKLVKNIIDRTSYNEMLENFSYACKDEEKDQRG
ncbi:MAG: haloacid dehalogenase-like hydrolase [Lachnospiraceae bacterium]|nr:haloacid dehalogenase-like hydrolase [Lachnospiraceae bacterium]